MWINVNDKELLNGKKEVTYVLNMRRLLVHKWGSNPPPYLKKYKI